MKSLLRLFPLLFVLSLSACSSLPGISKNADQSANAQDTETTEPAAAEEEANFSDFDSDKDTLYDLLVAEIAAQRDQFNITLLNYIQQARLTRDPGVIKRAINAAQYTKDIEAIQELGKIWVEVEPDNIPAHQLMAFQYSLQKNYVDALYHIDRLIELGGEARIESLAIGSQQLPEKDKLELLGLYQQLYDKYPENSGVAYSLALVHRNLKQTDEALALLEKVTLKDPEFQPAALLKANVLYEKGDFENALDYAADKYDDFPENHALGRLYASLLIDNKQLDEAEEVFAELMELYPQAPGLKLSHALVMLENEKIEAAEIELQELIDNETHQNEANFYLGRIADQREDSDQAIAYYSEVKDGIHFESALERSSYLLTQQDKVDEAIERLDQLREDRPNIAQKLWILQYKLLTAIEEEERANSTLDQAVEAFPDDEQLLYARAMSFESRNMLAEMEKDLRVIIKNNPQNAVAINALGYTLADRTDRLQEALALITVALSLKPDNPAILDSMGWVLYRLGKQQEALVFLAKAFQNYPDAEVGAHLGEVLWQLGKQEDASTIWRQMLYRNPEHKVLVRTLERLAPHILEEDLSNLNEQAPENNEAMPSSVEALIESDNTTSPTADGDSTDQAQ